jgi:cyclin T
VNSDLALLQVIATAALFLAAKSEETARPLNNVLRASCEISHKQDISFLSYLPSAVSIFIK